MTTQDIAVISCGGTIDKIYFDAKSDYTVGEPAVGEIFRRAGAPLPPPQVVVKKDSLNMTDDDRAAVVAAARACPQRRIVVTHGTDTLAQTALALHEAALGKTIALAGAFAPAVFRETDADFNVGFAVAAALALPPGVYVTMNGQILPAASARKNRAAGRFESTT